jgi:hypothetical protein
VEILIQCPVLIFTPACRSMSIGEDDIFRQVDWEHGKHMPSSMPRNVAQLEMAAALDGMGALTVESTMPCSFGLSATSQQYSSLRTNQPLATSQPGADRSLGPLGPWP